MRCFEEGSAGVGSNLARDEVRGGPEDWEEEGDERPGDAGEVPGSSVLVDPSGEGERDGGEDACEED